MVTEHGIAIAMVIESDDFAAEVAWILNPLPPGTLLYEGPNAEVSRSAPLLAQVGSTDGLERIFTTETEHDTD